MRVGGIVVASCLLVATALANDTSVQLTTNGLEFVTNDKIAMQSEDLYISADEIRVKYVFRNDSDETVKQLVAFPLPDLTFSYDGPVSEPYGPLDNLFQFVTTFDGEEKPAKLYEYAFVAGVDRAPLLSKLGVPLVSTAEETREALNALTPLVKRQLEGMGLIHREVYDNGEGGGRDDAYPLWTYRASYIWEAEFPANDTVEVEHRYVPSVGGTTGTSVLDEPDLDTTDDWRKEQNAWTQEYIEKYCIDDTLRAAVRRVKKDAEFAPFWDSWISYIVTTGNNWASGYIENFRLVVDKGDPKNLVSFCGEDVKKIGPTTFEMVKENYWADGEIEILLLRHFEPEY